MRVWGALGEARAGQGIAGREAGRLGWAVTQGVGVDVCAWQGEHGSLPRHLQAAGIAPRSRVRGPGRGGCKTEGCRRGRAICVCMNLPQVRCHTDPPWEPGAPSGSAGPCLATSCCHLPGPRASPATPAHTGSWFFFLPRQCGPGRGNACARHRPPPPPPRADPVRGSQTTGQRQRLPRRHFLRNSQVPAPSASAACGLPLYFSPNRLPGCHGMSGCSGIGREFRIWRRPCWSLRAWSAQLL